MQLFNISEFEIRTKPQCFQSLQNKKNYIPQSKIFTYNIIETPIPNDPLIQYKYYKQNIYKYVQITRDQIENPINPINFWGICGNFKDLGLGGGSLPLAAAR